MVIMQSAEADLNWSRLLADATEAGSEFQVLTVRGKKEKGKASTLLYNCLYIFVRTSSSSTAIFSVGHRQGKNRCHFWTSLAGRNL